MEQTKILFRVDASLRIGTGHVMRCLTLADALRAEGAQCIFICREHPGNFIAQIRQRDFSVHVIPLGTDKHATDERAVEYASTYESWLGVDWVTDAEQSIVSAGETAIDWLIVDHYALDARWERVLRPLCRKLMVIDDLANRQHDCDLLLDQNLGREASDYSQLVPDACKVLAGPNYALLRPEFPALRENSLTRRSTNPQLKHILISMGGVDQADATGKALEALMECSLPADLRITVVMGEHAPWLHRVKLIASRVTHPMEVKVNVRNMAQLMAQSDLAIGAAGGTSWERCCLGLPAIVVVLADNQRDGGHALEQRGCVKLIDQLTDLPYVIREMLADTASPHVLSRLSQSSSNITDGNGTIRVREAMGVRHGL
jgi:UDP-2,4-diacetamido-2,4,6-trideoxy-beta-L-altropyranose hydrolase